jgi:pyrroline-5-carboxylate reductase
MLKLTIDGRVEDQQYVNYDYVAMTTISFIGLGNMGSAIAKAISNQIKEDGTSYNIGIYDKSDDVVNNLAADLKNNGTFYVRYNSISDLVEKSNIVVLCVKPQILASIYPEIKAANKNNSKFISIAAGVNTKTLCENLDTKNVVRFMPNIAAKASSAITAVAAADGCCDEHYKNAMEIAKTVGGAFVLDEDKFSAFIGISGSAIAYVFDFVHAIALGGTREGIPYDKSVEIAFQTMESAIALYNLEKENPISLMTKVCSAGGTTIEGVKALSEGNFENTIINAVSAATQKSKELEKKNV